MISDSCAQSDVLILCVSSENHNEQNEQFLFLMKNDRLETEGHHIYGIVL